MTELEQKAEEIAREEFPHDDYKQKAKLSQCCLEDLKKRNGGRSRMTEQELKLNTNKYQNTVATIQEDVLSQRIKIEQLEKENHQLKNDYEMIDNCYRIVKKEKEILAKENEVLGSDLQTAVETNRLWLKRNTALEEQIEKMKCCSNCKQYKSFLQNECTYDYLHSEECKKNHFSKWELAEGNKE